MPYVFEGVFVSRYHTRRWHEACKMGLGGRLGAETETLESGMAVSAKAGSEVMADMEEGAETMCRVRIDCSFGKPIRTVDIT
jgi:hypothetical protein